jgi:hypothetical protein
MMAKNYIWEYADPGARGGRQLEVEKRGRQLEVEKRG